MGQVRRVSCHHSLSLGTAAVMAVVASVVVVRVWAYRIQPRMLFGYCISLAMSVWI
jgi:hypothetical protein